MPSQFKNLLDRELFDLWRTLTRDFLIEKAEVNRKPPGNPGSTAIQSLIFEKDSWTVSQARAWLRDHEGFGDYSIDETEDSFRFRQYDPKYFSQFRIGDLPGAKGIKAVYGRITKSFLVQQAELVLQEADFRKIPLSRSPLRKAILDPIIMDNTLPSLMKRPAKPVLVFVLHAPSTVDKARGNLLAGREGRVFNERYLAPLGLTRSEVQIYCQSPGHSQSIKGNSDFSGQTVITIGSQVSKELRNAAHFRLPHPASVAKSVEQPRIAKNNLERKIRQIKKFLDNGILYNDNYTMGEDPSLGSSKIPAEPEFREPQTDKLIVPIQKADGVKQVVYGVVMDPYSKIGAAPDAHNDWLSPAIIEKNAWSFMRGDRIIGLQHTKKANAQLIESSIEQYPTPEDRKKAFSGEPHSVWRRPFGADVVHSGSWIVGVQLGDAEWDLYQKGKINAFSPGGFGVRKPLQKNELPVVKFIDLVPHA